MKATSIFSHPLVPVLSLAVSFAFSSGANAQARSGQSADASVTILRAASAEQANPLDFGRVLPSAAPGEVTLFPDGRVACSGGVVCGSGAKPARFVVSGSDEIVAVTVSPTVELTGPSGDSIRLVPMLSAEQLRVAGGSATLSVGGTLTIAANQPPGRYNGRYELSLQYQ